MALESLRRKLDQYLEGEIERGSFPGAVYAVGRGSEILLLNALGFSVVDPATIRATSDTIYDVASLTKPLLTTTLVLLGHAQGAFDLHEPVSKYLEELKGTDKAAFTFVDLLSHRSGFEAWYPMYTHGPGPEKYLQGIVRRPLQYPTGTGVVYSDLGFITLHLTLRRVFRREPEEMARQMIFQPLGLRRSLINPPAEMKSEIAATEWGNSNERRMVAERGLSFQFRDYMIWGEVDDGNAWYMGGLAGNAGLFSTAADLFELARMYLMGGHKLLPSELVTMSLKNYTEGLEENRGLGWQLRSSRPTHPSAVLGERCYGHTGFTGTSLWVDPDRDLIIVLLTNRLHSTARQFDMQVVRRNFHALVIEEWDRR